MESQIRILLVEDNPGDARLLNEYLSKSQISSFSVVNASSIQQAGQCLERDGKFDIILLDLSLPDSQGLATVSQLRSICPDKALVVLTGLDDESAGIEALRQGAQDYLVKGQATPRILGRAIFHSIARRKIELEREELLEALKKARDELELRVKERTRDLQRTVDALQSEIVARIQAEDALRESNELLERMFDSIYLNVAYMDADFNFIRVNRAFAASDGQEPEYYVGKNHFDLFPNEENEAIFREVRRLGQPCFFYEKPFVYASHPEKGVTYWDWSLQPVKDVSGKVTGLILSLLNVTERVFTREQLDAERRRLFSVLHELPGYVSLHSPDFSIRFANQRFVELFGYPRGRNCYELLYGRKRPCSHCRVKTIIEKNAPEQWEWTSQAGRFYHVWGYPFSDIDGTRLVLELGLDITDRKLLQKQILEISDSERRKIGQDLHDVLGQNLTGIAFLSKVLAKKLADSKLKEAQEAQAISAYVNQAIAQTRSIARGLCPVGLTGGLVHTLQELAATTEELFGVSCHFTAEGDVSIVDGPAVIHIYSIVREAVNNAVRHGKARTVAIRLAEQPDQVVLTVADDGRGLPEKIDSTKGMGLHTMRYRADTIGAAFKIEPGPDKGAVVSCFIPKAALGKQTS